MFEVCTSGMVVLTGEWEEKYKNAIREAMERVVREGVELGRSAVSE
jgi:hypothetical protein